MGWPLTHLTRTWGSWLILFLGLCQVAAHPSDEVLPDYDQRRLLPSFKILPPPSQQAAVDHLKRLVPSVSVDRDDLIGTPVWASSPDQFLTGRDGQSLVSAGKIGMLWTTNDPDRAVKLFLAEHSPLFGHGAEILGAAVKKREFTMGFNGRRTTVWEQHLNGIPVYEGLLVANVTAQGELANLSSRFVPNPSAAAEAGQPNSKNLQASPPVSAKEAMVTAIQDVGEKVSRDQIRLVGAVGSQPIQLHRFKTQGLPGEGCASLVWLPLDRWRLRLCWSVEITRRHRGETYRVMVDALTGAALARKRLTFDLTEATYNVFTSDSPTPFSPGYSAPSTNQPPFVSRSFVTLGALITNASPVGWIADGDNETRGNNVDAHLDRDGDNLPDLPRPQGSPFRVFDYPIDFSQSPQTYGQASVVQLFYWCNWMHDRLYALGFTEAAGNFQKDNFGRGGLANDVLQADAQDGTGFNNANFTPAPDGTSPRIQMFTWVDGAPDRDGSLDAEVVLHEYTHGLTDRMIGGGAGIGFGYYQTYGLAEGWSDFYALALLAETADDLHGCYPMGGYVTYLNSGQRENYYFGIRRYPYSTDMSKNPLTFKDIDPNQASAHAGVARSSTAGGTGSEPHRVGEVWCSMLWDARAAFIAKYGAGLGAQKFLQLATAALPNTPPNPTFIQARNAILNTAANQSDRLTLWTAFAKRGLGTGAQGSDPTTTIGVRESFDTPDNMTITPTSVFVAAGPVGGAFTPGSLAITVANNGQLPLNWSVSSAPVWLTVVPSSGQVIAQASNSVTATVNTLANGLAAGNYSGGITFLNHASGQTATVPVILQVTAVAVLQTNFPTEIFNGNGDFDLDYTTLHFTPTQGGASYSVCRTPSSSLPNDPAAGEVLSLVDDCYKLVTLTNDAQLALYGRATNAVLIGSNGDIIFDVPVEYGYTNDPTTGLYLNYFYSQDVVYYSRHRLAPLYLDLNPGVGGVVSWQQLSNRTVVTWLNVPEFGIANTNTCQVEWFYDGTVTITYAGIAPAVGANFSTPKVGLWPGGAPPADFVETDFSAEPSCLPPMSLMLPPTVTEDGSSGTNLTTLTAWPGTILLSQPSAVPVTATFHCSLSNAVVLPTSVVFSPGQMAASVSLYVLNDHRLTGPYPLIVTASASGYGDAVTPVLVQDSQSAAVTINVPAHSGEGDGERVGWVQLSAVPDAPISIGLSSSQPDLVLVPSVAIVPAGTNTAEFRFWVNDDNAITGPLPVLIHAEVENWPDDYDVLVIDDNETTNLSLVMPSSAQEGAGVIVGRGIVSLGGVLPTNLVVSLTSENTNALLVPTQTMILAGQTESRFDCTVPEDNLVTGTRAVKVHAMAPGFVGTNRLVQVLDNESPSYPTNPVPAHLATNIGASQMLRWSVSQPIGTNLVVYDVYFGTNPVPGIAQLQGSTQTNEWLVQGLALHTVYYWRVAARVQDVEVSGPVWQFTTVSLHHFSLSSVASPQWLDAPFPLTVTAIDDLGNVAAGFADEVELTAWTPSETPSTVQITEVDTGVSDRIEFANVSRREVDVSDWQVLLYDSQTWPQPHVSFTLPSGSVASPGMLFQLRRTNSLNLQNLFPVLVYSNVLSWANTASNNPVAVMLLDRASNLVDFVCAFDADASQITTPMPVPASHWSGPPAPPSTNANISIQRIGSSDNQVSSDWMTASNTIARTNAGLSLPFVALSPVPVTPAVVAGFVAGTSSVAVAVHEPVTNLFLRASYASGIQGMGNNFSVAVSNDISLRVSLSAGRQTLANPFSYEIEVVNTGPEPATGVQLLDQVPPEMVFVSVSNSQGTATFAEGSLACDLGTIIGGSSARVRLTVRPDSVGIFTNRVIVSRAELEAFTGNNTSLVATVVGYPLISSSNISVLEGNSGLTPMVFSFKLSEPSERTVSFDWSTSDGTAVAGEDYEPSSGTIEFAPGNTNATVSVQIFGDTLYEASNTVFLVLSSPVNAHLTRDRVTGAALNDDPTPYMAISDATVVEGDEGQSNMVFTVGAVPAGGEIITVSWTTSDGTATAGLDYVGSSGQLVIPAGTTNQTLSVPILGNELLQSNRTLFVTLTAPKNGYLVRNRGTGTILDDDAWRLHRFAWSAASPTQYLHEPFIMTLTALDGTGRPVTNFNSPVNVTASLNSRLVSSGTGAGTWEFPLASYYHDSRLQVIYPAAEIGTAGRITALSLDLAARPGQTLSNWTIRLKHTALASFGTLAWDTNWTVVYRADQVFASTGWVSFIFQTPFDFNGQDNLMADFSFNNSSFTSDGLCRLTTTNIYRSLYFRTDGGFGDPLDWAGAANPAPLRASHYPNARFRLGSPADVTPATVTNFVNGVWVGAITPFFVGPAAVLNAIDAEGHLGSSDPFTVIARDTDGDGLPDEWETEHGLNINDPTDAAQDPDLDGLSNLDEFYAGTDPNSASSNVRILSASGPADGYVTIHFLTATNRYYLVEYKSDLADPFWRPAALPFVGTGQPLAAQIRVADFSGGRFYRVKVVRP